MSIGLVITVLILSMILGILGKQTLSAPTKMDEQQQEDESNHFQAI